MIFQVSTAKENNIHPLNRPSWVHIPWKCSLQQNGEMKVEAWRWEAIAKNAKESKRRPSNDRTYVVCAKIRWIINIVSRKYASTTDVWAWSQIIQLTRQVKHGLQFQKADRISSNNQKKNKNKTSTTTYTTWFDWPVMGEPKRLADDIASKPTSASSSVNILRKRKLNWQNQMKSSYTHRWGNEESSRVISILLFFDDPVVKATDRRDGHTLPQGPRGVLTPLVECSFVQHLCVE